MVRNRGVESERKAGDLSLERDSEWVEKLMGMQIPWMMEVDGRTGGGMGKGVHCTSVAPALLAKPTAGSLNNFLLLNFCAKTSLLRIVSSEHNAVFMVKWSEPASLSSFSSCLLPHCACVNVCDLI